MLARAPFLLEVKLKKLLFLLIILFFIFSCSDDNDSEFSFKVRLVDDSGNPINNINVTLLNNIDASMEGKRYPNYISFRLAEVSNVEMKILNIKNELVKNIMNEEFEEGNHTVVWDGVDEELNPIEAGLYYCQMKASVDGDQTYYAKHTMYLYSYEKLRKHGVTDFEGIFQTEDKKPFVNLFGVDSLQVKDEQNSFLGNIAFPDSTLIYFSQMTEENTMLYQKEIVKVNNDNNSFEFVWNPQAESSIKATEKYFELKDNGDEITPEETYLEGNYPNPFN